MQAHVRVCATAVPVCATAVPLTVAQSVPFGLRRFKAMAGRWRRQPALHWAAKEGQYRMVRLLLANGADAAYKDNDRCGSAIALHAVACVTRIRSRPPTM